MIKTSELAKQLGVSAQTVRNMAKSLRIEVTRVGNSGVFTAGQADSIVAKLLQNTQNTQNSSLQTLQNDFASLLQSGELEVEREKNLLLEKRIDSLLDELSKERQHSREKTDQIADLSEKLAASLTNAQLLHGGTMKKQLADGVAITRFQRLKAAWRG